MRDIRTACLVAIAAAFAAAPARSQELSAEAKAYYEKQQRLKRTVRDPLRQKLTERRDALAKEADLKDVQFLIQRAQKAYKTALATDPEIVAARKADEAAEKALADAAKARLAANPKIQAVQNDLDAAKAAAPPLEAEVAQIQKELEGIRAEVATSSEVQEAKQAYDSAKQAYYDLPQTHPKFVAARAAVANAEKALEERVKDLPETRALAQAKKAYSELRHNSPEVAQAKKARNEARQAYDERLDQAVRSSQKGSAVYRRLEAVQQSQMEAQAMRNGLAEEIVSLRTSIGQSDPVIVQARQAYGQAHAKYKTISRQRTADEQKALASAQADLEKKVRKKMAMDPMLLDLADRLRKVEKECEELRAKYAAARAKATGRRRR